ncbi:MAG: hypothetical protein AAF724_15185 [Pseudomonadota bacterium]
MSFQTENSWVELEYQLQTIQNEINHRRSLVHRNVDPLKNRQAIESLRAVRSKVMQQLAALG